MNSNLTVTDPLADQDVTIIITLAANHTPLAERPLLLSMGVSEQLPVVKTGVFANLMSLIEDAWTAFGVRAQVNEAAQTVETVTEEQLLATATTNDDEPAPAPPPHLTAPKPQAKNLSLF